MTTDKIEVMYLPEATYHSEDRKKTVSHPNTWWWRQVARNGEIVCTSEMFGSAANARRAAKRQAKLLGAKLVDETREGK